MMFSHIFMARKRQVSSLDSIETRVSILLSMLADAVFVVFFIVITYALSLVLGRIEIDGFIDKLSLKILQWAFGIATIIPAICYTLIDMWRVIVRTWVTLVDIWERRREYRKV